MKKSKNQFLWEIVWLWHNFCIFVFLKFRFAEKMVRRKRREQLSADDKKRIAIVGIWLVAMATLIVCCSLWCCHRQANGPECHISIDSLEMVKIPASLPDTMVTYKGFTSYYNTELHVPNCVVYELKANEVDGNAENDNEFMIDEEVEGCAGPWEYQGSGYQRGHMAPAADFKWDVAALFATYYMTNICPQMKVLNEGTWRRLEEKVREWAQRDSSLIVITGPVLSKNMSTIGQQTKVAVPEKFFKVILAPYAMPMRAIAFVMPNGQVKRKIMPYAATVDEVEQLTGLDFFSALPDDIENRIEANSSATLWMQF